MSCHRPQNAVLNVSELPVFRRQLSVAAAGGVAHHDRAEMYASSAGAYSCTGFPSGVAGVITVGASDLELRRYYRSNWGECVDLHAPGVDVTAASIDEVKLCCDIPCVIAALLTRWRSPRTALMASLRKVARVLAHVGATEKQRIACAVQDMRRNTRFACAYGHRKIRVDHTTHTLRRIMDTRKGLDRPKQRLWLLA